MQFDAFRSNPHDDPRYSRERKVRFGYDNAARLKALDPVVFVANITNTLTACSALEKAMGRTGSAVGIGRGQTVGTDAALEDYRDTVGSKYRVAQDRLRKQPDVVVTVFGNSIQKYTRELTKTNAAARMEELDLLLEANKDAVGEDIVEAIGDAVAAYTGKRTVQREALGKVETAQIAAQAAETALEQQLWVNACFVVLTYPSNSEADAARRAAAANYSLLERPDTGGPLRLKGTIPASAVLNLLGPTDDDALTPDTPLTFTNKGTEVLRFSLSKTADDFDGTGAIDVAAGQSQTLKASALGDVAQRPYLNVQNPTGAPGAYEVVVG